MSLKVGQLLHGYRRGHERLGGSMRLPTRDADLIARLSDLSGTLAGTQEFKPYVTVYPLPSRTHMAVAKTWPDASAARAGCVLTHTLLVPVKVWKMSRRLSSIATLFRQPVGSRDEAAYSGELDWHMDVGLEPQTLPTPFLMNLGFVQRYFAEGKRPIVWFSHPDAEMTLWLLLDGLWPALKANFSACTLCLQPRTLEDRPFDLMFAPTDTYPRFLKIPQENFVDASRPVLPTMVEPWCRRWAERLFSTHGINDGLEAELWADLDDDPTAVRRLYLIEDALMSESAAPQAAVGAMDLLESIARPSDTARRTKVLVAKRAVELASRAENVRDGLESLQWIEDRLRRTSYQTALSEVGPLVADVVAKYTREAPELVASVTRPADAPTNAGHSWFARGVLGGFREIAKSNPENLAALRSLPSVRTKLLEQDPSFAALYAMSLFARRNEDGVRQALTEWLRSNVAPEHRVALRRTLLPQAVEQRDTHLLHDLLRNLLESEVKSMLRMLAPMLQEPLVADLVEATVVREYPDAAKSALKQSGTWDDIRLRLLAATYPASREGLTQLLADDELNAAHRGAVVAAFLISLGQNWFPTWVRRFAEMDERVWNALLHPSVEPTSAIDQAIEQLLKECEGLPLAHFPSLLEGVLRLESRPFFPRLLNTFMQDLIRGYLDGSVAEHSTMPILYHPYANNWMRQVLYRELRSLFTHQVCDRTDNWINAWKLLQLSPSAIYERESLLPDVVDSLLRAYYVPWSPAIASSWAAILQRARSECLSPQINFRLSVQALQYSLSNSKYPLSTVVVATFLDVYRIITSPNYPPSETLSLFGWMSWDKGKELRKSLIDVFMHSQWPPSDLALAVAETQLFRKIFKRIRRRAGGDRYLHAMLADLHVRPSSVARQMEHVLESLLSHPEFYEEWD